MFVACADEKYFGSQVIKCKDGSKSFSRDRLNDNFCDCLDGTDEPDCCDGSDEYGSGINCPNTCVMGGDLEYKAGNYISHIDMKESKRGLILEELFQKARGIFSNETLKIIPRCSENNVTNELVLVLTRIEGDNHPTGGYPSLCSDLQNILSSDQVQKKTLPLKKTTTMPHKLSPVP
ncbi:hypothetical protein NC652_041495 [Populus alba x Populus x berolinensis]|nr:hypothetical protein NC652_041495 [Populus alba x Populus x berolinensis]